MVAGRERKVLGGEQNSILYVVESLEKCKEKQKPNDQVSLQETYIPYSIFRLFIIHVRLSYTLQYQQPPSNRIRVYYHLMKSSKTIHRISIQNYKILIDNGNHLINVFFFFFER
jgi:hypothetical protein